MNVIKKTIYEIPLNRRFRMFSVKFVPATNHLPARVRIHDLRHDKVKFLVRNSDDFPCPLDQATNYLEIIGIPVDGLGLANSDNGCVLLSSNLITSVKIPS